MLEPALFSKDYYRLIHPNYVEEEKTTTITSEPQTPINCRAYINPLTPFNYVYFIDAHNHDQIQKIELFFPKQPQSNKYKMVLRMVELFPVEDGLEEKQVYYRYFHEDNFFYLTSIAYKDTEIYKKNQINYLSLPGEILSGKTKMYKLYVDFLIATTIPHNRYKETTEPCIIVPIIHSQKK